MNVSPGTRKTLAVALPIAAIALAIVALRERGPEPSPAPPASAPEAAPAHTPERAPGQAGAEPEAEEPEFDVVRVEPDGSAVVAGTAAPGAEVTIYADDAPLAQAEADAEGNFVAIFEGEPSSEPQALTLGAANPGGGTATSDDVVMLLPPTASEPDTTPAEEETAPQTPDAGGSPEGDAVAKREPAAAPKVAATAILRDDAVEVTPSEPGEARQVTLASISYAEAGRVTLAGAGTAGAVLRAYVDDSFAHEGRVGADGRWSMQLGDMAQGVYRLRIDQLGPDGEVASRVETPFQRDYPPPPPPRPGLGQPGERPHAVTVQPGNNLWTLARQHYGSGVMYTQIFTANRELIRNPDLIYPGQIFRMPAPDAAD